MTTNEATHLGATLQQRHRTVTTRKAGPDLAPLPGDSHDRDAAVRAQALREAAAEVREGCQCGRTQEIARNLEEMAAGIESAIKKLAERRAMPGTKKGPTARTAEPSETAAR